MGAAKIAAATAMAVRETTNFMASSNVRIRRVKGVDRDAVGVNT
jgi:hypothetical protein